MNSRVPDELISAYFDGEASPDERAAVERQLADIDEVRHELDETARLSALLHSIPRESAPSQLAADVQRATDQMPLAASTLSARQPAARSLRREWIAAGTAALVTAASLLLCVRLFDQSRVSDHIARALPASAATEPLPALASNAALPGEELAKSDLERMEIQKRSGSEMLADQPFAQTARPTSAGMGGHAPSEMQARPAAGPVPAGRFASADLADGVAAPVAVSEVESTERKLAGDMPALPQFDNSAAALGLSNGAFLEGLKVGNVYEFVPKAADTASNVAVVELEVVDVERGAETIQVLLKQNSILPRAIVDKSAETHEADAKDAKVARSATSPRNDGLVVVYAAGPGGQLAKTLEDVNQHPDLFLEWSSQPPVQLANVDESRLRENSVSQEKKDGRAADKQKLDENRKESDSDSVEAAQAVQSLVTRNTLQYGESLYGNRQSRAMKGLAPELARNEPNSRTAPFAAPASPTQPELARAAKSAGPAEEPGVPFGASVASRDGTNDRGAQGFQQVFRLPMTEQVPLADQIANQNSQNDYALNGLRRRVALPAPQGPADALRNNEANRAVKMLFVLHQTPGGQGSPAPMLKARQQ